MTESSNSGEPRIAGAMVEPDGSPDATFSRRWALQASVAAVLSGFLTSARAESAPSSDPDTVRAGGREMSFDEGWLFQLGEIAGAQSPTFDDRNVTSRVVVQDGQTIGLAGLITDNTSIGNQGIPWLKDIPILGLLAGTQNNTRQRTELLILITPHVIHDQRDARALTEDLRDQLVNAAAVPNMLNTLPPSGDADPSERLRKQLHLQQ